MASTSQCASTIAGAAMFRNVVLTLTRTVSRPLISHGFPLNPTTNSLEGPAQLKGPVDNTGALVGCNSACSAGLADPKNSPNCCTGRFNSNATCPASGVQFYNFFSEFLPVPSCTLLMMTSFQNRSARLHLCMLLMARFIRVPRHWRRIIRLRSAPERNYLKVMLSKRKKVEPRQTAVVWRSNDQSLMVSKISNPDIHKYDLKYSQVQVGLHWMCEIQSHC